MKYDVLTGHEARTAEPSLSSAIGSAVRLHDQRYLNPPAFLRALAAAVRERGGHVVEAINVTDVEHKSDGVRITAHSTTVAGETTDRFDSVVLANGAWLSTMARNFGVRQPVQAGRGYSFSVACDQVPAGPVYFPTQRVALHPAHHTGRAPAPSRRHDGVPCP